MPCMCGDICCPSCGPAQGNYRCVACGAWASEGCECTEEDKQIAAVNERMADELLYQDMLEMERQAAEYDGIRGQPD